MLTDRYDNPISTSSQAARDAYDAGLDRFLAAAPDADLQFQAAAEADPDFALAHVALARARHAVGDMAGARAPLAEARRLSGGTTEREQAHVAILGQLIDGQGAAAHDAIMAHADAHPRDALAMQPCMGVFSLIGFSGRETREEEYHDFTTRLAPAYGGDWWFLGQHAFAQMESGRVAAAEDSITRSLDGNPRNANAAHYRAHLYYENGETEAGFAYIDRWREDYDKRGMLHCHVSWHVALWALERGDIARMWQIVDADVAPDGAWGPALNVLTDMAAILFRAELAGLEVDAARWQRISAYATKMFPEPGMAFADAHAAIAHAMAGDSAALERLIRDAKGPAGHLVRSLGEGFGALAARRWAEAEAHFSASLGDHQRIGGSRAQRDFIEFAMVAALLRQGKAAEARATLDARRPVFQGRRPVVGLA